MPAPPTLLKDFQNGQGVGFTNYADYAVDQDSNWTSQDSYNVLVAAELTALQGGGAFINYDLVQVDNPSSPGGVRTVGVIGAHSYRVTINGDTTKLDVTAGSAIIQGNARVRLNAAALLTSPLGGAAEHFVAVDVNGNASIETGPGIRSLDVASATWNGSIYTNVTAFENIGTELTDDFLATIMFDGDAHIEMLTRPTVGNFVAKLFLKPDARLNALERKLQNVSTDSEGNAIGDLQLDAAEISLGTLATARGGTGRSDATVANSNLLVGQGTGVYALEAGTTLRTSIGVGSTDTPRFARLGLGAAADGTEEILLMRTSTVKLGAGATPRLQTTTAHDLQLLRNSSLRIDLTATGLALHDGSASKVIEIGASDTLGFYAGTPVSIGSLVGEATMTLLAEVIVVVDNLINLLDASGLNLFTDDRT